MANIRELAHELDFSCIGLSLTTGKLFAILESMHPFFELPRPEKEKSAEYQNAEMLYYAVLDYMDETNKKIMELSEISKDIIQQSKEEQSLQLNQ